MDLLTATTLRQLWALSGPYILTAALLFLLWEQLSYLRKRGPLPGPSLVLPFFGGALKMVLDPAAFWAQQAATAQSTDAGLSAHYLLGRFILFIRSSDLSHQIFANVRPDAFHLIGHPFGKKLFGEHNLIYLFDQQHKDLRRRIAPNFTAKALSTYIDIQQRVIVAHINRWLDSANPAEPKPLRLLCRDLNLETSQTVFAGPYLTPESRARFSEDYKLFNVGLMKLPFDFPGTAFRRARLAVSRLVDTLAGCAAASKERMRVGKEPSCLVDFWMQESVKESAESDSDQEIGGHLFDFLFAAQDASTSSLLWAVAFLDSHPDVLRRVRDEVRAHWSPATGGPITAEILRELKYTEAVVREVIRIRPPAPLVPHVAGEEFKLTEWYTVPKGTIVFPSTFESSFQGFSEPDRFDPDRFSEERQEDRVFKRNFLAFGAGPHQCVGQRYALNHLTLFVALFVSMVEFKRHRTDGCDKITYVPTIVPRDDCLVYLARH